MRKAALSIIVVFLVGCSGAATTTPAGVEPTPTPTPTMASITPSTSGTPAPHIYVAQTCAGPTSAPGVPIPTPSACFGIPIAVYSAPLNSSSAPQPGPTTGSFTQLAMGFDSAGQLLTQQNQLVVYNLPLTASSAPAFTTFFGVAGTQIGAEALDASGNLYLTDYRTQGVDVVPPPLTASSTIAKTITLASGLFPGPIAMAGTRLFVVGTPSGQGTSGNSQVMVFDPPYSAASATFSVPFYPVSAVADSLGDLYLAATFTQTVQIYAPPFTATAQPVVTITIPSPYAPEGLAFDGAGNLLVSTDAGSGKGAILVYAPPFSKASAPSTIVSLGAGASGRGLATGP